MSESLEQQIAARRAQRAAGRGAPPQKPPTGTGTAGAVPPSGRRGILLKAPGADELGSDYTVKDVLRTARDLNAKQTALANQIQSRTKDALRDLGKIDKNGHLLDLKGAPSIYDVAENPTAYALTERQRLGLSKLGQIIEDVRLERQSFGVAPQEISVFDEGHFLPRTVKKTQGVDLQPRGAGGGALRGGGKERGRRIGVGEVAQAEAKGVVYAHPLSSVENYAGRWLKASSDTHIRDLLVPFSETSTMRVSPALKAQVDGLRKSVASLRQTAERLAEKEDVALRAFAEADTPNPDALRDLLDKMVVGANAVGKQGRNFGKNHKEVMAEIKRMRDELRDLAPEWRAAKEAASTPRPGRQTVPMDVAPALAGRDFEPEVAKAITKYYGAFTPPRTQVQRVMRTLQTVANVPLRFFNATLDLSAWLRQQASAATVHPVAYLKNVFKGLGDVIDSTDYDRMVGSAAGQEAASSGIAVFGNATEVAEFQAAHWMHQIPVIGRAIRFADNNFIRFNTRQRIELFHLEKYRLEKQAKAVITQADKEALAKAINRATGVSTTRGGDLETAALFASRYTRSTIEEVIKAASSNQIEGQIARRYIGHLVAVTTTMVTAVALAQKRPLEEVLNPLDMDALRRGELSLNLNFQSMRLFGNDVKPLGAYDSLARLMFVATDSMIQAVKEREAQPILDFFMYAASTKGSPLVSFGSDLVRGRTFNGEDPLSLSALGKRPLPFTAQNIIQSVQRGLPVGQALAGGAIGSIGLKTSPMSHTEQRDARIASLYGEQGKAVVDELNRFNITLGYVGKKLDMELGEKGGEIDLTSQQRDALQDLTEDTVIGGLREVLGQSLYTQALEDEKVEVLKDAISKLRAKARAEFRQQVTPAARPSSFTPNAFPTPAGRSSGWAEVFQAAR